MLIDLDGYAKGLCRDFLASLVFKTYPRFYLFFCVIYFLKFAEMINGVVEKLLSKKKDAAPAQKEASSTVQVEEVSGGGGGKKKGCMI